MQLLIGIIDMVDDEERTRLVHIITALANVLVFSNFSLFRVVGNMLEWTLDVQIFWWVLFIFALIAVNVWVYYTCYKKPQDKARSASS